MTQEPSYRRAELVHLSHARFRRLPVRLRERILEHMRRADVVARPARPVFEALEAAGAADVADDLDAKLTEQVEEDFGLAAGWGAGRRYRG